MAGRISDEALRIEKLGLSARTLPEFDEAQRQFDAYCALNPADEMPLRRAWGTVVMTRSAVEELGYYPEAPNDR